MPEFDLWKYMTGPQALTSLAIVVCAVLLWYAVRQLHRKYVSSSKAKGETTTLVRVMFGILRALILAGTVLAVLQVNGVNVTSLVAGLGLLSAIVGLAVQDALKDAVMGMHIMSDHFFSVGDVVKYGDIEGVVTGFTMKTTTLRNTFDGSVVTICNRNISEITRMPVSALYDIDLPISYDEDFRRVHSVLEKACERIGKLEGIDRCIYKGTQEFGRSAVYYKVRYYCLPENKYDRNRDALRVLQEELDAAGLRIPYEQMDIHTDALRGSVRQ